MELFTSDYLKFGRALVTSVKTLYVLLKIVTSFSKSHFNNTAAVVLCGSSVAWIPYCIVVFSLTCVTALVECLFLLWQVV